MLGYPLILCYKLFANSTLNKALSYSLYNSLTVGLHLRASEYIISLGVILQLRLLTTWNLEKWNFPSMLKAFLCGAEVAKAFFYTWWAQQNTVRTKIRLKTRPKIAPVLEKDSYITELFLVFVLCIGLIHLYVFA